MDHPHLYQTELAALGYGRPVWEPDPGTLYDCIHIGDVGYFQNEKFVPLFNILPPDPNRNRRLPFHQPDFPALHLPNDCPATHNTTSLKAGLHAVDSNLVFSISGGMSSAGSVLSGETSCSFANEKGAALILPFKAFREDTLHVRLFKEHMLKHYRQWYNFALVDLQRDIKLEDLILVTGCVLTRKWTTATYSRGNRAINATLGAQVVPVAEFKFSSSAGWTTSLAINDRSGPDCSPFPSLQVQEETQNLSETLANNQCVFLRGFCVKDRFLGKTLKGAAGYHDPGKHGPEEEGAEGVLSEEEVIVESLSPSTPGESLITVLLDYMLEESDADVVIANDSDLRPYLRGGDLDNFRDTLKRMSPQIKVEDGVGSLIAEDVEIRESDLEA